MTCPDNLAGLNARDDLLWIVAQWPRLQAQLGARRAGAAGRVSGSTEPVLPIDTAISDLMREVADHAWFLGGVLVDETDWEPTTSSMPGLLREAALRYGHFIGDDAKTALDFCDDASDYRERVRKALEPTAAPTYIGPCAASGCDGRLKVREGREGGMCPECGEPFTLTERQAWLLEMLAERLMTLDEIPVALKSLGKEVSARTWQRWLAAKPPRLEPVDPETGLYRLADAVELADAGRRHKPVAEVGSVA